MLYPARKANRTERSRSTGFCHDGASHARHCRQALIDRYCKIGLFHLGAVLGGLRTTGVFKDGQVDDFCIWSKNDWRDVTIVAPMDNLAASVSIRMSSARAGCAATARWRARLRIVVSFSTMLAGSGAGRRFCFGTDGVRAIFVHRAPDTGLQIAVSTDKGGDAAHGLLALAESGDECAIEG